MLSPLFGDRYVVLSPVIMPDSGAMSRAICVPAARRGVLSQRRKGAERRGGRRGLAKAQRGGEEGNLSQRRQGAKGSGNRIEKKLGALGGLA